ncbi:WXG100 family type VII secretion target [Nonomuraea polychroma]|uniref:WXG100 family type VII secretion target n=1 Tax=Nonomuraea polychroma TaxID=46176 RepID=UPI003D933762
MTNAAGYCQDTAQYIEGMRQRVQAIKNQLTTQGWKGGASAKFSAALDQWDVDFRAVIQSLEGIYDKLNMGAGVYKNAAEENMDLAGAATTAGASRVDSLINR